MKSKNKLIELLERRIKVCDEIIKDQQTLIDFYNDEDKKWKSFRRALSKNNNEMQKT